MSLRGTDLTKIYAHRKVVDDVNIEVNEGEIVGLLGPNGAGKTTTFYMIVGVIKPNPGAIYLNRDNITQLAMYKRARTGIGYLPQEPSIFRKMTVEENIKSILQTLDIKDSEKEKRLFALMDELGVKHLAKSKAYTLSGGEKRRVEIARSLVTSPHYILLDEPFLGIDPLAVIDIQEIVKQLKKRGLGILITDHNVRETLKIIDRAYIMYEGKILLSGNAEELSNSEEARQVYLGPRFTM